MLSYKEAIIQRIFILIPVLILFYMGFLSIVDNKKIKNILKIFFSIQIIAHILILLFNKRCTPNENKTCNNFALVIGIIFLYIFILYGKKDKIGVYLFCLFVITYIILSHLISIYPLKNILKYNNINLPILDINTYIIIISNLFHEKKLNNKMNNILENNKIKTIVDIGGYVGDFTLFLSNNFRNKKFYCIEPSISNTNFINKIKKINNLNNLEVINSLISNNLEYYDTNNPNIPSSRYFKSDKGILSNTINNLFKFDNIDLLHIDVEGMELEVLQGGLNVIRRDKPIIIVEFLKKHSNKNKLIHNLLTSLNYKAETINESCIITDIFDLKKCRNIIYTYNSYL